VPRRLFQGTSSSFLSSEILFFEHFHPLEYLLHGVLIAFCKGKGRLGEGLEVDGHIIQPVECPITFEGIYYPRQDHIGEHGGGAWSDVDAGDRYLR